MSTSTKSTPTRAAGTSFSIVPVTITVALLATLIGITAAARNWVPPALLAIVSPAKNDEHDDHAGHGDAKGHDDHADHGATDSLDLSPQARKNIGLKIGSVALHEFARTITIPGIVEERPGRSTVSVAAPMTGVITRLHISRGHAVEPGRPLFELRLTHEELVQAQSDLLRTVEELDVISQEVKRLDTVSNAAIAGKSLLERKYEQQKAQAVLRAQRQTLILHGLSEKQVDEILSTRLLLHKYQVTVPHEEMESKSPASTYQVQALHVELGQNVTAGDKVLTLADHSQLFIAGDAFEKDIADIQRALEKGWTASALVDGTSSKPDILDELEIVNLDNQVDPTSRTIHVYLSLPNTVQRDVKSADGARFLQWRFKPGQRMQIHIPVEMWKDRIVVPIDAVVQDGVEWFVFSPNGDRVERRPVHVEYRDQAHAVIANDGALFPGDAICLNGAQQLLLALKNKTSRGIDPHAGHNH